MSRRIFINSRVFTMEEGDASAEAFVADNGRFLYVGDQRTALKFADAETEIIDLKNKRVIPGLNDSHMHLVGYGLTKAKADLRKCKSLKEIEEELRRYIASEDKGYFGDWILGHGWNEENFKEPMLPTAEFLDGICGDRPIYLSRACYHIAAVNSEALRLARIFNDTSDPEGGKIDRALKGGRATGILRENALLMAYDIIPLTNDITRLKQLIEASVEDVLAVGLTSVQTEDFGQFDDFQLVVQAYKELQQENRLKVRVNLQMLLPNEEKLKNAIALSMKSGEGDEYFRLGPLKLLADGSLGGRTAALEAPYADDPENRGLLIYEDEKLRRLLRLAFENGLQPAIHAIGDGAMSQVLELYQELYKGVADHRARLIHCQITNKDIIRRMAELKVIGDIQPGFLPTDIKMVVPRIGEERAKESYGWNSMLKEKVRLAGSSDAPIEDFNPFLGIYSAVTRRDYEGKPEGGWYPEECLTLREAIELYTTGSAYATFEENIKGKIKEGYLADFILLDRDIFEIPESEIKGVRVIATYVGGDCKFSI